MRVYIAGPISGGPSDISLETKRSRFYMAQERLAEAGHDPVVPLDVGCATCPGNCNPHGHVGQDGVPTHSWECFMRHDLLELLTCNAIALLPGWQDSRGARLEIQIAEAIGMTVLGLDENGETVYSTNELSE